MCRRTSFKSEFLEKVIDCLIGATSNLRNFCECEFADEILFFKPFLITPKTPRFIPSFDEGTGFTESWNSKCGFTTLWTKVLLYYLGLFHKLIL